MRLAASHKLLLAVIAVDVFIWSARRWDVAAFDMCNLVSGIVVVSLLIAGWIEKKRLAGVYALNRVSGALILSFALFLVYPVKGAIVIPTLSVLIFGSAIWIDLDKSGLARLDPFHKLALTSLAVQAVVLTSDLPGAVPSIRYELAWEASRVCLYIFMASMLLGWIRVKTLKRTRALGYIPSIFAVFFAIFLSYPKRFYITLPIVILLMLTRKLWAIPEGKPSDPDTGGDP